MKKTTIFVACSLSFVFGWLCCLTGFFYVHLLEHGQVGCLALPPVPSGVSMPERMVKKTIGDKALEVKFSIDKSNITLSMFVHVQVREKDVMSFDKRYKECKTEIEDHIATILRASTVEELMEASFTTAKEKMKQEINRVLGTPWVQRVAVTEISLREELQ
jgi:hypothetical protein